MTTFTLNQTRSFTNPISIVMKMLNRWTLISQQRKALLKLSYKQLDDIGISQSQVSVETSKFFWQ